MAKKQETIFAEKIDKDLKKHFGKYVFLENIQQIGKAGTPDRLICIKGRFVAIEIKTNTGKLSEIQKIKLNKIKQAGGLAYVATPDNWPDILKELSYLFI